MYCYVLQHGQILETLCLVKETKHKKQYNTVSFIYMKYLEEANQQSLKMEQSLFRGKE